MKIDLCFSGRLRGFDTEYVTCNKTRKHINISKMKSRTVIDKLNNGIYSISLKDAIGNYDDGEIEIFDFDNSEILSFRRFYHDV